MSMKSMVMMMRERRRVREQHEEEGNLNELKVCKIIPFTDCVNEDENGH